MNYSGIIPNDIAAAPGICVTLFVSGCPLDCKGCHNSVMQNPAYGKPFTEQTMQHILDLLTANGIKRSFCIMGGEPLAPYNVVIVNQIIQKVKKAYPEIKICVWTGYTIEDLKLAKSLDVRQILNTIDCLIDGPFIQEERDITLPMRGSRNQRIIWLR